MPKKKHLHPDDWGLFHEVRMTLAHYAQEYNFPLRNVEPLPRKKTRDRHGDCSRNRDIRICLREFRNGKWSKKREKAHQIVDTMAHELAHLRYWKHGQLWMVEHAALLMDMANDGVLDKIKKMCEE